MTGEIEDRFLERQFALVSDDELARTAETLRIQLGDVYAEINRRERVAP